MELNTAPRPFCEKLKEAGALRKETYEMMIRIAPPLVITKQEIDWVVERIMMCVAGNCMVELSVR